MNKTTWHEQMRILILTLSPPPPKTTTRKNGKASRLVSIISGHSQLWNFFEKIGPKLRAKGTSFFFSAY